MDGEFSESEQRKCGSRDVHVGGGREARTEGIHNPVVACIFDQFHSSSAIRSFVERALTHGGEIIESRKAETVDANEAGMNLTPIAAQAAAF